MIDDEPPLPEGARDRPRFDRAAHVHLQRNHRAAARRRRGAPVRVATHVRASTSPAMPRTASGVQKKKPCSGDASTCSACGAAQFIFRVTSSEGRGCRSAPGTRAAAAGTRWQTPAHPASAGPNARPTRRTVAAVCPAAPRPSPAKSRAGASAKSTSCSRTIATSAPARPSSAAPRTVHASRTCSQMRHEQRHRERRAGMRKRRRDVHVEEERRARARRQGRSRARPLRRGVGPPRSRERWRRIHRTPSRTRPPRHTGANSRRPRRRVRPHVLRAQRRRPRHRTAPTGWRMPIVP